jgi:hypothetical protein
LIQALVTPSAYRHAEVSGEQPFWVAWLLKLDAFWWIY